MVSDQAVRAVGETADDAYPQGGDSKAPEAPMAPTETDTTEFRVQPDTSFSRATCTGENTGELVRNAFGLLTVVSLVHLLYLFSVDPTPTL